MGPRKGRGLSGPRSGPRPGPGAVLSVAVAATVVTGVPLAAQDPRPDPSAPDTMVADTAPAVPPGGGAAPALQDTVRADTTPEPPPRLLAWPGAAQAAWRAGVWAWDRDALLRSGAFTLSELLERVPGLSPVRSGLYGQPEVISTAGGAPGRVEVRLDGYVLDGLRSTGYDLSDLEIMQLESVRVERWPDRLRIDLRSFTPTDATSKTLVEAGTGDQDTNLFRGSLRVPRILGGPLAAGLERLSTNGIVPTGSASRSSVWAGWTLVSGASGMQLEVRSTSVDRSGPEGAGTLSRSDWVARARTRPFTATAAEVFVGASTVDDSIGAVETRRSGLQAGVRLALDTSLVHLAAAARFRTLEGLPATAVEADVAAGPVLGLGVHGFGRWEDWGDLGTTRSWGARALLGPLAGLAAFAEATGGRVGVPFRANLADPLLHRSRSVRAGAEFSRWGLHLGGAVARIEADSVPGLGVAFDTLGPYAGPDNQVLDVVVRVPTGWKPLWFEGSYTRVLDDVETLYVPDELRRGAIVYHQLPLPSGNLEIYARLEHWRRGAMLAPDAAGNVVTVPRNGQYDFYLQIRVVSVRTFLRWHNFTLRREQYDLPLHAFPIQRIYYGVKWSFTN